MLPGAEKEQSMNLSLTQRNIVVLICALLFAAVGASAQTGTTSLHGVVTDKTGSAIVGAKITLTNSGQGWTRETATGSVGDYDFLSLPPGTYALTIEKAGFRKFDQKNLQLLVNSPETANVTLEVGSTSETIEVTAQAATLNTTDASLGQAFDENQIKSLPLEAGNVPELLSLQAGVAYMGNRTDINRDNDTRSGAVNGARSDQSNITLDGVDVNADTKGYAFTSVLPITADSVEEFRVTTSNYNADEGRSSGAQVTLVTKSGTNDFHGSLFEIHRNTYTSANDYFVKLAQLSAPGANPSDNKAPKLIRNIFGGSLGGPILKDRFFFFVNYQAGRQSEAQSVVRVVPSAAMQDGVITYQCQDPTMCPATNVQGLTGSHAIQAGFFGLTPAQIKSMDPLGIGISTSVMVPYLQSFAPFVPNDNSVGDGVNFVGFRFKGPVQFTNNWYIARADYKITRNGNHSIFWRGALRNDKNPGVPYLPGGGAELTKVDFSKGFSVGYAAVLRPTLVNNFRWGYTRQSFGEIGNQTKPIVFFRGLNDNEGPNNSELAVTSTLNYQVPVNNFVDDLSWVKGKHTLQFGGNLNFLRNPQSNNVNSFSSAFTNASWFDTAALANQGDSHFDPGACPTSGPPTPTSPCLPAVNSNFGNNYDYPMITLVGMVNQVNAQYNFTKSGTTIPQGVPVTRRFGEDFYEMYAQDSWKVKSNLTLTYGLRYSLFSAPWETNGLQVAPNVSLSDWFAQRGQNMLKGTASSAAPLLSFDLSGPANGKAPFWDWDYKNFAPRIGVAWSPGASSGLLRSIFGGPGKTTIRAGAGVVYDRLGPAILATFDSSGAFGLSTSLTNTGGVETPSSSPRITGLNTIPTKDLSGATLFAPAPAGTFPQTFPSGIQNQVGSFAVYWGMDNKMKTPYSYTLDFSVGRDLGHGLTLEVAYVGRLSHRLASQVDVATPEDLVDPKTGIDYFTAVRALANIYRTGVASDNITAAMIGPTASYWQDLMGTTSFLPGACDPVTKVCAPPGFRISRCAANGAFASKDPVVAAYDLFCGFTQNETTAIQGIDQGFGFRDFSNFDPSGSRHPYYPVQGPYTFLSPQFAALYTWRTMSSAQYHAMQVNVRKHMSHGVQFDFNYTFSKGIDISSDANRVNAEGGLGANIIDAWKPNLLRAVSDFDTTHQFNANWIIDLPFGKGRWIGTNAHGPLEAIIGGWELTGIARWTSGFPFGVSNGAQWPTNWQQSGYATEIASVSTHGAVKNPDGSVNVFGNDINADPNGPAAKALANFRPDFPGEVGARNNLRGQGFAGLDAGLSKRWKMPWKESHSLQLGWEVFNVLNLTRFDVNSINQSITNSSTFGNYTGLLTNPRVMQFALRYEF
jgi:hypothetical protein